MKKKLLEWILNNLPGKASYAKNPYLSSLKELITSNSNNAIVKTTRDYYKKLTKILEVNKIPEITIIDGQGDYIEIYNGGLLFCIKKTNNLTECKIEKGNSHLIKSDYNFKIIIQNDLSSEFHLIPEQDKQPFNSCFITYYNNEGNVTRKVTKYSLSNDCILLVGPLSYTDINILIRNALASRQINKINEIGNTIIESFVKTIMQFTDKSTNIFLNQNIISVICSMILNSTISQDIQFDTTFFLIENNGEFNKVYLNVDGLEFSMFPTPISKEEVSRIYKSDNENMDDPILTEYFGEFGLK